VLEGLESRTGYFFEIKNDLEIDEQLRAVWKANRQNLLLASQGGVRVFMGTGAGDPTVFYGYSAHEELRLMIESGLSPMQALVAATRAPAEYFGALREWGTIETGKRADLVLLDANPLDDIRNTSRVAGVAIGGRWLSRARLDAMIRDAMAAINGN
jgi:imidazolonepropionase-like amidohydrolase